MRATFISSVAAFLFAISPLNAQTIQATSLTLRRPSDAELKNFNAPNLESLNIQDGRDLTDAGLEAIGKLDQLRTLYIHRSAGTDRGLAHLARLKKLESLNIRLSPQYSEAALKHFKNLAELKQFEFSGTLTGAGLLHLRGLQKLEQIKFGAGKLAAEPLKVLATFPELVSLTLIGGRIDKAAMSEIAAIPGLKYLSFYEMKFEDGATPLIADCRKLLSLSFRSMPIQDADLKGIEDIKSLEYLTLYATRVTDAGIESLTTLPNLAFLNLAYSPEIDDEVLDSLVKFKKLKDVILNSTGVTKEGGREIREALPNVTVEHLPSRKR